MKFLVILFCFFLKAGIHHSSAQGTKKGGEVRDQKLKYSSPASISTESYSSKKPAVHAQKKRVDKVKKEKKYRVPNNPSKKVRQSAQTYIGCTKYAGVASLSLYNPSLESLG